MRGSEQTRLFQGVPCAASFRNYGLCLSTSSASPSRWPTAPACEALCAGTGDAEDPGTRPALKGAASLSSLSFVHSTLLCMPFVSLGLSAREGTTQKLSKKHGLCSASVRLVGNLPCPGCCSEGSPLERTGAEGWFPKGRSMVMSDHQSLCWRPVWVLEGGHGVSQTSEKLSGHLHEGSASTGVRVRGGSSTKISDDSGKVLEIETPSSSPIGARTVLHPL